MSTASGLLGLVVMQETCSWCLALEFPSAGVPALSVSTLVPLFSHAVLPEHPLLVGSIHSHQNACNREAKEHKWGYKGGRSIWDMINQGRLSGGGDFEQALER